MGGYLNEERSSTEDTDWFSIRVGILLIGFILGVVLGPSPDAVAVATLNPASVLFIALLKFVGGALAGFFAVVCLQIHPAANTEWAAPSWSMSPLSLTQPLQLPHFVGIWFLVVALGQSTHHLIGANATGSVGVFADLVFALGLMRSANMVHALHRRWLDRMDR